MSVTTTRPLPAGWRWATLREIAEIRGGVTKGQRNTKGEPLRSVPYLRVANVQRGYLDLSEVKSIEASEKDIAELRLRPGDILFNEGGDRDKLGRGWIWRGELPECIHQNHVFRARLRSPESNPKLISLYANFVGHQYFIDQGKQTTNLASINLTKLGALPVPVPPAAEQERIVAEVEKQFTRLDAGVEALKRLQAHLRRYRAAVLKAACEGRLVPTEADLARAGNGTYEHASVLVREGSTQRRTYWRDVLGKANYSEPAQLGHEPGPLPEGWAWATFEQLSGRVTVGHVGPMKDEYVESGIPFLRSQNVRENRFDPEGLLRISPEFHAKLTKSVLHPGDIAIVRSGSVGTACVIPESLPDANCSDLVVIQKPLGLVPQFAAFYMNSLARALVRAGQVGIALAHFNTKSVASLPVPLPPLREQHRIVAEVEARLSNVAVLETTVIRSLMRASRLRSTILRTAFEGRLILTEEPARAIVA
jgi:type I restriction enzyme S subunit